MKQKLIFPKLDSCLLISLGIKSECEIWLILKLLYSNPNMKNKEHTPKLDFPFCHLQPDSILTCNIPAMVH